MFGLVFEKFPLALQANELQTEASEFGTQRALFAVIHWPSGVAIYGVAVSRPWLTAIRHKPGIECVLEVGDLFEKISVTRRKATATFLNAAGVGQDLAEHGLVNAEGLAVCHGSKFDGRMRKCHGIFFPHTLDAVCSPNLLNCFRS